MHLARICPYRLEWHCSASLSKISYHMLRSWLPCPMPWQAAFLTVILNHSTELPQYHCVLHLATIKCGCRAREIAILNQHSGSHPSTRAFAVSNAATFDSGSVVLVLWQNRKLPYGSRCAILALVPVHSAKSTCIGIRVGANLR